MDKNQFNYHKYDRFLSDFGKKVLHELIQWNRAQEKKPQYNFRQCSQTKKILNFNNNNTTICNTSDISALITPPIQVYSDEDELNMNVLDVVTQEVPTSKDLTKTVEVAENVADQEFVHPTIISSNVVKQLNNHPDNECNSQLLEHEPSVLKDMRQTDTKDVNWDDMFDSELLDGNLNNVAFIECNLNSTATDTASDTRGLQNMLPCENFTVNSGKRRIQNIASPKANKKPRKNYVCQSESKKKSAPIYNDRLKPNFRKQKYTKVVKNWLNDVKSFNSNNDETGALGCNENDGAFKALDTYSKGTDESANVNNNKYEIVVEKHVKSNKKEVQTRLFNKDGVMKFSKPKDGTAETDKKELPNNKLLDSKNKNSKKFVPPIKSQIPVKNITYNIITINDENVEIFCKDLLNVQEEIALALLFSNGFCQLNSHFTDTTSVPDGILIGVGDMFYLFKSASCKIKEALRGVFENNKIVISYDARIIIIYLNMHFGIDINTVNIYDAKIGASLLDPDNPPENFSDLQKLLSYTPTYTIAAECTLQKAAWYLSLLRECWAVLKTMLVENHLWDLFVDVETKLLPIMADMERQGILVDLPKLKSMEEVLMARMKEVEQECYKAAGKVFQINSALQVRGILYDELQLDTKHNVKIRETLSGGAKSTSENMLRSLMTVHPLPKLILEYRHLHKAHATFLAGIAQQAKDGYVRPTWVQTAAATGRIASSNPNLQAIPKTPFSLVMFPDVGHTGESLQVKFRSVYVSRAGWRLVAADFRHVECRVFAHAAADAALLRALAGPRDLFAVLAAHWLNKSESDVTGEERERTKRLVYASLYGAGTRKLMEILDLTYEQALQVAASFNRTFPSLKSFGRHVVSTCCQAGGRLATVRGRVRHFANITSEDFNLRSHAERQAVNFIVQGSAADICKTAMVLTQAALRLAPARLLLQIHDELVWEVQETHLHSVVGIIKQVMEGCGQQCGMSMSLPVAITVGKNWADMEEYSPVTI